MSSYETIVNTSLRLFAAKGYHGGSMRDIASECGIAVSTIYAHFKNKSEILAEILLRMQNEIERTFDTGHEQSLKAYCENFKQSLRENSEFWRLIHALRMSIADEPELQQRINRLSERVMTEIASLLKNERISDDTATVLLFWAGIDGIAAGYLLLPEYPLDEVLSEFIKLFENKRSI